MPLRYLLWKIKRRKRKKERGGKKGGRKVKL